MIPVTLLTGFLGAGKTTLLNRLLADPAAEPTAVIVNEFGEAGIDGGLIRGAALVRGDDQSDGVLELANGCICCTVKGDLQQTLLDLHARRGRFAFERVLVESSGLASPGPIGRTLFVDPELRSRFTLDGIVTLVHALHAARQLKDFAEAREQVALADRILLNHIDRVAKTEIGAVEKLLAEHTSAPIERCERAAVSQLSLLRAIGASDPERWSLQKVAETHSHSGAQSVVLETEEALDLHRLKIWLQFLGSRRTHSLLRVKGLLRCVGREETVVVQGMHDWLEIGPGEEKAPPTSRLVILGLELDEAELQRGFQAAQPG